jgi:hypothetical protein
MNVSILIYPSAFNLVEEAALELVVAGGLLSDEVPDDEVGVL